MSEQQQPPCAIVDCGRRVHARSLCIAHYQRLRRYGDPVAAVPVQRASLAASARPSHSDRGGGGAR